MKYIVSVYLEYEYEIIADSDEEALEKAQEEFEYDESDLSWAITYDV